jgi:DNA-directed RNA polymerase subunit RPC12/RpoP
MTRLSPDEKCERCGNPLYPPQLATNMKIAATADYVCLNCGRAYKSVGSPPTLRVLSPVAVDYDDDESDEP